MRQLLMAILLASPAFAQTMVFTIEETGQPPPPPQEGPPSEALANALRLYQQEHYLEAAVQFQRVVQGDTTDATANQQKAQFFLGKALYHLRFYQSALAIFDEITQQGQSHLYFGQTLQWLAQLATQLPEPAGIIERVGRYGLDQLEQFHDAQNAELYNHLLYLMGRFRYEQHDFEGAVQILERVEPTSEHYVNARFFLGIAHVRNHRAQPAIAAFRSILDALDHGARTDDPHRMRDLAWLSLARVYYTAANRTDDNGERDVDGRLLGNAVAAWDRIGVGSEYWLDALFEESWAFFLADQYSRAMGNIHTLNSPYFEDGYYPEAMVLKAVVFFTACQTTNVEAILGQFHERYDPVQAELESTLARYESNEQFFQFLQDVRGGRAEMSPRIRGIVATGLSDRTLLRHLEYVRLLDSEQARLEQAPQEFREGEIGNRVLQDIFVARSFAVEQTGDLARGRYRRLIDELSELMNQMDTVEVELSTYNRVQLTEEQAAISRAEGLNVTIDEEHQGWPFNGEYWRDELGTYRQQVTSQCTR